MRQATCLSSCAFSSRLLKHSSQPSTTFTSLSPPLATSFLTDARWSLGNGLSLFTGPPNTLMIKAVAQLRYS